MELSNVTLTKKELKMTNKPSSKLLKIALNGNAIFSAVVGLTCIVASRTLATAFEIDEPGVLIAVGVSLLPFAIVLRMVARKNYPTRLEVYALSALDLGWILGAIGILGFELYPLSKFGAWCLVAVTIFVFDFLVLQLLGLRKASVLAV